MKPGKLKETKTDPQIKEDLTIQQSVTKYVVLLASKKQNKIQKTK